MQAGGVSDALVSQIDLMATVASIVGFPLPAGAAEDSHDLLPLLTGETATSPRRHHVHNTFEGRYALRDGDWLLIDGPTGYHSRTPKNFDSRYGFPPNEHPAMLFHMVEDLSQRNNRIAEHPEKAEALRARLTAIRDAGHSAPRLD